MAESDNREARELKASLARALEELEEQRVATIELRMLLDASEARLQSMAAERDDALTAAEQAEQQGEGDRVDAIEMRVILDATAHRATSLETDLAVARSEGESLQRERQSLQSERDRLATDLAQATDERRVYDGLIQDVGDRLDRGERAAEELSLLRAESEAQRAELEAGLQDARMRLGELEERASAAGRELAEVTAERAALKSKLESLAGAEASLRRENEELRRHGALAGEAERHREENETLRARLAELEEQHAEAAQRHSAAVSKYMLELNQRTEELRAAQSDLDSLKEALELARQMCNDSVSELTAVRQENEELAGQARDVEGGRAAHRKRDALRLADTGDELEDIEEGEEAAAVERGPRETSAQLRLQPLTVVHLEDRPEYREALAATVAQYPRMHYIAVQQLPPAPPPGRCLLVANLLVGGLDPLMAIGAAERWGLRDASALTYCAEGERGVVLGVIDYFPEPFDADACTARLLEREEGIQRLLVVTDHIELMNQIRSTLSPFKISMSGALDSRQAFELASLVRPDYVIIDLGLPRGEGLRVAARLRSDAKTAGLPLALLWSKKIEASDLRVHAARVARDAALGREDFKRAVQQTLNERGFRGEALRETA